MIVPETRHLVDERAAGHEHPADPPTGNLLHLNIALVVLHRFDRELDLLIDTFRIEEFFDGAFPAILHIVINLGFTRAKAESAKKVGDSFSIC